MCKAIYNTYTNPLTTPKLKYTAFLHYLVKLKTTYMEEQGQKPYLKTN